MTTDVPVDEKKGWSTACRAGNYATCETAKYRCANPRHQREFATTEPKVVPMPKRVNASPSSAPRSKRDPKIDLVWEDPPERTNGRLPLQEILDGNGVLDALREKPGTWARVVTYASASGAAGAVKKLRKALPDYEWLSKSQPQVNGATTSGSLLYGRYVG